MKSSTSFLMALAAAMTSVGMLIFVRADGAAQAPPATQASPEGTDAQSLVGKPAPDFTLKGPDGTSHSLAEAKGHVVVLDFWATWCVACGVEQKHLMGIYKQRQADGLLVFAIDTNDDPAKVPKYISDNGLTLPVLLDPGDGAVATAYKVDQMPETIIIGKDGIVTTVFTDFSETRTPPLLEQAIAAAMAKP
jgi:peroxiredoxin